MKRPKFAQQLADLIAEHTPQAFTRQSAAEIEKNQKVTEGLAPLIGERMWDSGLKDPVDIEPIWDIRVTGKNKDEIEIATVIDARLLEPTRQFILELTGQRPRVKKEKLQLKHPAAGHNYLSEETYAEVLLRDRPGYEASFIVSVTDTLMKKMSGAIHTLSENHAAKELLEERLKVAIQRNL